MTCPGPMYKGQRLNNCGQNMQLNKVNDCKDGLTGDAVKYIVSLQRKVNIK